MGGERGESKGREEEEESVGRSLNFDSALILSYVFLPLSHGYSHWGETTDLACFLGKKKKLPSHSEKARKPYLALFCFFAVSLYLSSLGR